MKEELWPLPPVLATKGAEWHGAGGGEQQLPASAHQSWLVLGPRGVTHLSLSHLVATCMSLGLKPKSKGRGRRHRKK